MQQSKRHSLLESVTNVLVGYFVALASQLVILPLFGVHLLLRDNVLIGLWFTVISIIRSYLLRRWFTSRRVLLAVCCICLLSGCAGVTVKTHHGWMGPDVWEATDGKISVSYYNGNCCCVAEEVLQNLADKANSGQFDWSKMADELYQQKVLADTCWHVLNRPKEYR